MNPVDAIVTAIAATAIATTIALTRNPYTGRHRRQEVSE